MAKELKIPTMVANVSKITSNIVWKTLPLSYSSSSLSKRYSTISILPFLILLSFQLAYFRLRYQTSIV